MGEQIKSCFRFLLSCAGLLCGLALAGPIIEELGYFLTSAVSVIASIPFSVLLLLGFVLLQQKRSNQSNQSTTCSFRIHYFLGCCLGCMVI